MRTSRSVFSISCLSKAIFGSIAFGLSLSAYAVPNAPPYPAVIPLNTLDGATNGFRMDGVASEGMS